MSDEENEIPDWRKPTDAQLRSRRTVLRIQYLADRLRDDLNDFGILRNTDEKNPVDAVLFLQRYWKDDQKIMKRAYVANCCATHQFESSHLKELSNAATNKDVAEGSITLGSLKALFDAHDLVTAATNSESSFDRFKQVLTNAEVGNLESELAHELLTEAASSLPYTGKIPSALDDIGSSLVWFRRQTNNGEPTTTIEQFGDHEWIVLNQDSVEYLSIDDDTNTTGTDLQSGFETFLNDFLIGAPFNDNPPCYPSKKDNGSKRNFEGLAVPCYERATYTEENPETLAYSGTFLGWILISVDKVEETPKLEATKLKLLCALVNHFAERVMDATLVEVIGNYAEECRMGGVFKDPDEAFKQYFPKVEGWRTVGEDESGITLRLDRVNGDGSFDIEILKKFDTKEDENLGKPPEALIVRSQRLFRALEAFYSASRADEYKKQAQMLERLQEPLKGISSALSSMQSDSQELRAILFEPEEALFASHAEIAPFFIGGERTLFKNSGVESIQIRHSPDQYRNDPELHLQLILAGTLCSIFGKLEILQNQRHPVLIVKEAKQILNYAETDSATKQIAGDLQWLLAENNNEAKALAKAPEWRLSSILDTEGESWNEAAIKSLRNIKEALYSPFKPETREWNPLVFDLLLRNHAVFPKTLSKNLQDGLKFKHTPVSLAAVLSFTRELTIALSSPSRKIKGFSLKMENGSKLIQTTWDSSVVSGGSSVDVNFVRKNLRRVLSIDRQWRVESANHGDVMRPFIMLANKALGVGEEEGWNSDTPSGAAVLFLKHEENGSTHTYELLCENSTITHKWEKQI